TEQAQAAAQNARQQALQQQLDALEQQLQQALLSTDISAAQQLEHQLNSVAAELAASDVTSKAALLSRIGQLQQQLMRLPELAEQLTGLTRIVADWAAQPVPDNAEAFAASAAQLQQWQQQWRQLSKTMMIAVPASLLQAK